MHWKCFGKPAFKALAIVIKKGTMYKHTWHDNSLMRKLQICNIVLHKIVTTFFVQEDRANNNSSHIPTYPTTLCTNITNTPISPTRTRPTDPTITLKSTTRIRAELSICEQEHDQIANTWPHSFCEQKRAEHESNFHALWEFLTRITVTMATQNIHVLYVNTVWHQNTF